MRIWYVKTRGWHRRSCHLLLWGWTKRCSYMLETNKGHMTRGWDPTISPHIRNIHQQLSFCSNVFNPGHWFTCVRFYTYSPWRPSRFLRNALRSPPNLSQEFWPWNQWKNPSNFSIFFLMKIWEVWGPQSARATSKLEATSPANNRTVSCRHFSSPLVDGITNSLMNLYGPYQYLESIGGFLQTLWTLWILTLNSHLSSLKDWQK